MFRDWIIIVLAVSSLSSCIRETDVVTDVDPRGFVGAVNVEYDNTDTITARDIYMILRTNRIFCENAVDLQISVMSPDSIQYTETFTMTVPARTKANMNDAFVETISLYRGMAVLDRAGTYVFGFSPAAGSVGVAGVAGIGVKMYYGKR